MWEAGVKYLKFKRPKIIANLYGHYFYIVIYWLYLINWQL